MAVSFIKRYCGQAQPFDYNDQVVTPAGLFYTLLATLGFYWSVRC